MFKNIELYKSNIHEIVDRINKLHKDVSQKKGGNIFFRVYLDSDGDVFKILDIGGYDYGKNSEIERYAQDLCRLMEESFTKRAPVMDDAIPILLPFLGIGDFSTFVTGEIYFAQGTSWSRPCLENLRDYKNFEPIGTSSWYKKILKICEQIMLHAKGSGVPFSKAFFSPLDLAEALRGGEIYIDFFEDPEGVHELLEYCTNALIIFMEDVYALIRKNLGEEVYALRHFDSVINNMSEDIACLISPEHYREFAAPYTQRIINHFGISNMHCHSRALYLVKEICNLDNVMNLWIAADPNQPRPIDRLEEMIEDAKGVCLTIDCNSIEELEQNLETARRGNVSFALYVKDLDEGITATKRFRELMNEL